MMWIAGFALYATLCTILVLQQVHSFELLELAARYLILLPCAVLAFRSSAERSAWTPPPWFTVAVPLTVTAALLSFDLSRGILVSDESAYRFQASIFASGHITAEPLPGAVNNPSQTPRYLYFEQHIVTPREWTGKYYPGWPLLLAPFTAMHVQWLANPLLLLAFLWLTHELARRWFDLQTARLSVLLMAASPFLLARGVGEMSDLFAAVLSVATYLLFSVGVEGRWTAFAGMFALIAYGVITRPFSAAQTGVAVFFALVLFLGRQPRRLLTVLGIGLAFALAAYFSLHAYNRVISGSALVSPYAFARGQAAVQELTFNPVRIWWIIRKIARWSVQGTLANTVPFLFGLAALESWRSRRNPRVLSLALLVPVILMPYILMQEDSGSTNGERYYVEGFFAVAILAAAALGRIKPARALVFGMAAVQLAALLVSVSALERVSRPFARVHDLAAHLPLANGIVFLASSPGYMSHLDNPNAADWQRAPLVYLVDPGESKRAAVTAQFGRSHYAALTYDAASDSAKILEVR